MRPNTIHVALLKMEKSTTLLLSFRLPATVRRKSNLYFNRRETKSSKEGKDSVTSMILVLIGSAMLITHLLQIFAYTQTQNVVKEKLRVRCHETYLLSGSLFLTPSWIVGAMLNEESLR